MDPKNLFSANKFKFSLTGQRFKDNEFDITVTGINVPGIQLGTIEQATSIRTIERPGDSIILSDITMEFLITENLEEWVVIFEWLNDLRNFSKIGFDNSILSEGKLILLTNKNNPNIVLTFINMFPTDLTDLDLSLNSADGEPVRGNVTFKYLDMNLSTSF